MPSTQKRRQAERGSTLVLVMVILGVLSVIAGAAVLLASQERINASGKAKHDALVACAAAAQAQLWAKFSVNGSAYLSTNNATAVEAVMMHDGTQLVAPGHFGQGPAPGSPVNVQDVVWAVKSGAGGASLSELDETNSAGFLSEKSNPWVVTAHCRMPDPARPGFAQDHEVEFVLRFGL